MLASPIFTTRWRWDAGRALALLRFQGGKKVPPQIQRMRADDLLAAVFPEALACQENIEGEIADSRSSAGARSDEGCADRSDGYRGLEAAFLTEIARRQHPLRGRRYAGAVAVFARNSERQSLRLSRRRASRRAPRARRRDAPRAARSGAFRSWAGSIRRRSPKCAQDAWPDVRDADELHDALADVDCLAGTTSRDRRVRSRSREPRANHARVAGRSSIELVAQGRATRASTQGHALLGLQPSAAKSFAAIFPDANSKTPVADVGELAPRERRRDASLSSPAGWQQRPGHLERNLAMRSGIPPERN